MAQPHDENSDHEATHIFQAKPVDDADELVVQLDQLKARGLELMAARVEGFDGGAALELTIHLGAIAAALSPAVAKIVMAWLAGRSNRSVTIDGRRLTAKGFSEGEVISMLKAAKSRQEKL